MVDSVEKMGFRLGKKGFADRKMPICGNVSGCLQKA
jgi:hypothetical protein